MEYAGYGGGTTGQRNIALAVSKQMQPSPIGLHW